MKIKVVTENDKPISVWRALVREIIILVSFSSFVILKWLNLGINHKVLLIFQMAIIIAFFAVLVRDQKRRSYHDLAVKTVVVKNLG